jgi:hypothetical protein
VNTMVAIGLHKAGKPKPVSIAPDVRLDRLRVA